MARWLMKFEIEGHLGIEPEVPRLTFRHPHDSYEIHLENYHMDPGCEAPLLNGYVLFNAETIDIADASGEKLLVRYLDFLSLTTGMRFKVKRRLCLFDWTLGVTERQGFVYRNFTDPDIPQLVLNQELVSTIEALNSSNIDTDVIHALHWFAAAVSADTLEDQFELFWFSIETLARHSRDRDKVSDLCVHVASRCIVPSANVFPLTDRIPHK